MNTPSPCISQCLGDPQVTCLFWSEFRCPFRRSSQERRLSILQNATDNPVKVSCDWDSGNQAFTMLGLAAQTLDPLKQGWLNFSSHAMVPLPFRDRVRLVL